MIGIFGGTFDPVHYGHLRSALEVKAIFDLTQVRLLPCAQPAHRGNPCANAAQRLQMLRLAVSGQADLQIDDRELRRAGVSYMVDTLQSLRADFTHTPLLLFIGTDAFNGLTRWHCWQQLFDYAHIVVLTRPLIPVQSLNDFFQAKRCHDKAELSDTLAGKLFFQTITQLDISATLIRQLLARGENPRFLLPDAVLDYIRQQQLYL